MSELYQRLFDDAAIFPPGDAPMPTAVERHLRWHSSQDSEYVGAFILSAPRTTELLRTLPENVSITVSLTVPGGVGGVAAALEVGDPRLNVTTLEVPVGGDIDMAIESLDDVVPSTITAYLEVPIERVDDVAAKTVANSRHRLKLRTGGTTADAFPDAVSLASAIAATTAHALPFKLTAGLHRAVRHRDSTTGFEHHGFLNILLATAAGLRGEDPQPHLERTNAARVAHDVQSMRPETVRAVRRAFTSFGTCSIVEPLSDLDALGLLRSHR